MEEERTRLSNLAGRTPVEAVQHEGDGNYRTLLQNIPIGLYRNTPGPRGKFLIANPFFLKMFGFESEEELKGLEVADVYLDPGQREVFSENLLAKKSLSGVELQFRKKDGSILWGSITARVIYNENSNEEAYFDCVIEDITERKVEEALRQRQLLLTKTLQEVSALLTSQLRLDDVLESILDLLGRVINYDSASIQLVDEDGRFRLSAGRGFTDLERARQIVRDHSTDLLSRNWVERKVIIVPDTSQSSDWAPAAGAERIRSWIGAALLVKGRFIGTLYLDSFHLNAYDMSDGETVMAFANQAAIAIENARLFEAEEKRATQLESLRQASLSLTASLDLGAVLDSILTSVLGMLPEGSNGHIFLYSPEGGGRIAFGSALLSDGRRGQAIGEPRPEGITHTVARTGEPILVPDMRSHPLYVNAPKSWSGSIIGLPLKIGARVVGVMNIAHLQTGAFSDSDLGMLRLLGDQAAIAIENARLFEQAETERRHLALLYDIGRELAPRVDIDEILSRAITLTCEALGGTTGKAFLFLPAENRLSLRGIYGYPAGTFNALENSMDLRLGKGLAGWVAEHRQPIEIPDVNGDPRWMRFSGIDDDIHAALATPILHQDQLFGVLTVFHHRSFAFSQDQLDLLETIGGQVGLALSNVERYQEIQHLVDLLAAEQARLESLVERLPVGVLLLDAGYHVLVANTLGREMLEMLGAAGSGQPLDCLGPFTLEELLAHHDDPFPVEIALPGPPRRVFEIELRSLVVERSQWIVSMREVTQERQNQARIQMQERLATVGQLAAGIAHDFNNIMAAILVYTDLLKRELDLNPAARDRLAIIQQQVHRAASLIRQILDFSRRSVMEQSTLDLLPFVKELDKLLDRVLPETIRLDLVYQPEAYLVNADPTRLQQVFMNLAVNARDAMPEGGVLRFELSRLHLGPMDPPPAPYLPPGDWVAATVADNGNGIPAEALPHIFEPFFTTKPVSQGTGLGLAQAYGIIKQHDGYLDVHSRVGEGTTFTIYLPALSPEEFQSQPADEITEIEGQGELVLVVEDDDVTREALQALLEAKNYQVMAASDGREALDIYGQQPDRISLIVSDIVMPGMGGMALYRCLKERWPQVKMLFVTGHPLQEENQALLQERSVSWLQKPFSVADFGTAIQALINEG